MYRTTGFELLVKTGVFLTATGRGIELVGTVADARRVSGTFVTALTTDAGAKFVAWAEPLDLLALIITKVAMMAATTTNEAVTHSRPRLEPDFLAAVTLRVVLPAPLLLPCPPRCGTF